MDTVPAKTIIARNKHPGWFGFEYNMNIYRGCSHGCIYCDSRSLCYRDDSFDTVKPKADALRTVRDELRRKAKTGVIATGSMSDPYNPLERELNITRNALELINSFGFGVGIATKGELVRRDKDILTDISKHSPVILKMTVTTADDGLCAALEPGAPPTSRRLDALGELSGAGLFCGVLLMPVLPFINDTPENILGVVRLAKQSGARFIYPALGVTLRDRQRDYYYNKLDGLFPGIKDKYIRRYGGGYSCAVPNAKALYARFASACDDAGILYNMRDIIKSYRLGYESGQLSLF